MYLENLISTTKSRLPRIPLAYLAGVATYMLCLEPNVVNLSCLVLVLFLNALKSWDKKQLASSVKIISPLIFILTVIFNLAIMVVPPVEAALFDPLKDFVVTAFPDATELVSLIFNGITFLLLAYFAVAIVLIIRGLSEGQPISSLIQTPLTVVLVVLTTEIIIPFLV